MDEADAAPFHQRRRHIVEKTCRSQGAEGCRHPPGLGRIDDRRDEGETRTEINGYLAACTYLKYQGTDTCAEQRETGIKTGQQGNQHRRAKRDEENLCARKRSPPHWIRGGDCRYLGYAHRYFLLLLTWFRKSCRRHPPGPA